MSKRINGRKFWIANDRMGVSASDQKREFKGGIFIASSVGIDAFGLEYMDDKGFLPKVPRGKQVQVQIVIKKTKRAR